MAWRWVNLGQVAPLILGMGLLMPQAVETPVAIAQSSQSDRQTDRQTEAQRLYEEGENLREQGTRESLQQALAKFQQALPLFRADGGSIEERLRQRNGEADNLDSIGRVYDSLGQASQAIDYFQQALPIWREVGNRRSEAITLGSVGVVYGKIGQPQQELSYYQQALTILREVGDRQSAAITLSNIAEVYNNLRQYQEALNSYQQALLIRREVVDSIEERLRQRQNEAIILTNMGDIYSNMGQIQQALDSYQQVLPIIRELGDSPEERLRQRQGEAIALNNIGYAYGSMGQTQQALDYYQQALPINRELGNRRGEARTLSNIAVVYGSIGQPQQALNILEQALPISKEVGDRIGEVDILSNIGSVNNRIGKIQQALNYYQQALLIIRELGDRIREARTLSALGNIYSDLGQLPQALTYHQQALVMSREVGDRNNEAAILNNLGKLYKTLDQPQQALGYYQQALPIIRQVGNRSGEASILVNLGQIYTSLRQYSQALNFLQQALPITREIDFQSGEATALNNIGFVYASTGQTQQALTNYQQSLSIHRATSNRAEAANVLANLAYMQQRLNNLPVALENIQEAIAIVEDIRGQLINPDFRTSYFASVQSYYKLQIDLLMQLHTSTSLSNPQQNPNQSYAAQAFNVTERSKARTLLELLTESKTDIRTGVDPQLLAKEQDIQSQLSAIDKRRIELANSREVNKNAIADLEAQRATLQTQSRNLQAQIRSTSPKYAALKYPQPLNLEQIQQQILDDNTIVLSYSLGEIRSYLWLVSKTEMTSYQLPSGKILEDLINKKARPQLTNPRTNRASLLSETSELSNILLKPVLEKVGNKRLVVISDGALQYIPFGALPDPRAGNNQYQPLLVNNEVVYLPSVSTLQTIRNETQNRIPAPKTLAVLADPVFSTNDQRVNQPSASATASTTSTNELPLAAQNLDSAARNARGNWSRLPGTRRESDTILRLVPPSQSLALFDFQANRENALSSQLSQYRFIHWATHGFANAQNPELSGIVMSLVQENGQQQDGYLLLGDIFNLNFNADLVVLSACQTGLGEVVQGEGLIGLTRGLMYAGTPRVVTSLWEVPDEETATLMGSFYTKLLQQNKSPAEALRSAQLEMFRSRGWLSPYFWAAFTLQGEWR